LAVPLKRIGATNFWKFSVRQVLPRNFLGSKRISPAENYDLF